MKWKATTCAALLIMGVALFAAANRTTLASDTNGPGPPVDNWTGCGPPNANGPCNDPSKWTLTGGIGNGWCGRCGDKTFARSTGKCTGALVHDRIISHPGGDGPLPGPGLDPRPSKFDCKNCTCRATGTYFFTSTPVGSWAYAACLAGAAAGFVADAACFTACAGVCIVSGVFTLGTSCVACIAGCGAAGAALLCAFDECIECCTYTGFAFAGNVPCCTQ